MDFHSANSAKYIANTIMGCLYLESNATGDIIPSAPETPPSYYGNAESDAAAIIQQQYYQQQSKTATANNSVIKIIIQ